MIPGALCPINMPSALCPMMMPYALCTIMLPGALSTAIMTTTLSISSSAVSTGCPVEISYQQQTVSEPQWPVQYRKLCDWPKLVGLNWAGDFGFKFKP
jgi:hypothetical protein